MNKKYKISWINHKEKNINQDALVKAKHQEEQENVLTLWAFGFEGKEVIAYKKTKLQAPLHEWYTLLANKKRGRQIDDTSLFTNKQSRR